MNSKIIDNTILETIRRIDAVKNKIEYAIEYIGDKLEYANLDIRAIFYEGLPAVKLKCIAGFNHYSLWNYNINKGLVLIECL